MRKILFLFLCSLVLTNTGWAQSLSDQQVLQYAVQQKKAGKSEADIASGLMQKGATMDQIQRIRSQYAQQITKRGMDDTVDNALGDAQARMRTNNEPNDNAITASGGAEAPHYVPEAMSPSGKRVFGRDIFNNKKLSFEPQMNIATPQNYVVGPGDQLIIDIYGASQQSLRRCHGARVRTYPCQWIEHQCRPGQDPQQTGQLLSEF